MSMTHGVLHQKETSLLGTSLMETEFVFGFFFAVVTDLNNFYILKIMLVFSVQIS